MTATPLFAPIPAIANTPLPDGYDESALCLRRFILNAQQSVKANDVIRHRLLKDALHQMIAEQFGDALDAMIEDAAHGLYEKLCSCPEDEQEADEPDGYLPLDLPGRETD